MLLWYPAKVNPRRDVPSLDPRNILPITSLGLDKDWTRNAGADLIKRLRDFQFN